VGPSKTAPEGAVRQEARIIGPAPVVPSGGVGAPEPSRFAATIAA